MKKILFTMLAAGLMLSCTKDKNPLLEEWNTPFQIPPFESIMTEHYMPAFEVAIAEHKAEIDAIINNTQEPTFENTIEAYDKAGSLLTRINLVFGSTTNMASNPEIEQVAVDLSPILSKHSSEINLNEDLFKKIKAVYEKRETLNLEADQLRLVETIYKNFVRYGAELSAEGKAKLATIDSEIASLELKFGQNLLKETAGYTLILENEEELAGLSDGLIASAAARATAAGAEGKWYFGLDNPSVLPFLFQSDNKELRKDIFEAYINRGNNNNDADNKAIVSKLVELRLEKAKLLGYNNYAEYALETRMAQNQERVYTLLNELWEPALNTAKKEAKDINSIIKSEGSDIELSGEDWRYYFDKAKAAKYSISDSELMPYFENDKVRDGIFALCEKLWGVKFVKAENTPLPHPNAEAYECVDKDGSHLGILFLDMFARPGEKRGGAWCTGYRPQSYANGSRVAPLVSVVCNFTSPVTPGAPALLTPDEVTTFFHEFGHAIESLFKDVRYMGISDMTLDFVELPSQLMEHWAFEPELLQLYATHYETGEVIPTELVEKLLNSGKYGQGFGTTEFLAAALLDMDYHTLNEIPEGFEPVAFEAQVLSDRGLLSQIPARYRSTYFAHVFASMYTAGYYSYIWANVLDCDAYQAFKESGDIFNQEIANKVRTEIFERGGEDDAMTLYVNFRGSEPGTEALIKNRGLK